MNFEQSKVERLVNLLRKMASITYNDQPAAALETQLEIHNHRNENWDDIWLLLGTDTEIKQPLIKVALIGLSSEERSQLDLKLHSDEGYTGRSEHVPTAHNKTALFKFIHKSAEKNIRFIGNSE